MIGKIISVDQLELINQDQKKIIMAKVKVFDEIGKTVETVQLPITLYDKLKAAEKKYIVLPFSFFQHKDKALLSVSERYPFRVMDHTPLGYIV